MKTYELVVKWHYTYDKESTWYDEDDGVERYEIKENTAYPLPYIHDKCLEIRTVNTDGGCIRIELYVDHHTVTVYGNGEAVVAFAHDDYMVCGDSVSQTLRLEITVQEK